MLELVLTLCLTAAPQGPQDSTSVVAPGWVADGATGSVADAHVVQVAGAVELTRHEAHASAARALREAVEQRLLERTRMVSDAAAPAWLPRFLAERTLRRELARLDLSRTHEVVDRHDEVRDHGFGRSYQTHLLARENGAALAKAERRVAGRLVREGRLLLVGAGATLVWWAFLGLVLLWVDRLSRGYMTGRLWVLGLLLGSLPPALVFLH